MKFYLTLLEATVEVVGVVDDDVIVVVVNVIVVALLIVAEPIIFSCAQ